MEPEGIMLVSFRGAKLEFPIVPGTSVRSTKLRLIQSAEKSLSLEDIKIFHKGKVISDEDADLYDIFAKASPKKTKKVRLMATGISSAEAEARNKEFQEGVRAALRIRDDLSDKGRAELATLRRKGQMHLSKAAARHKGRKSSPGSGFGKIETLSNLPEEAKAREILTTLATDPGVLACLAKHNWKVGCLSELYPEGKVGESDVCIMGLNQNKGQKILLRIRTDDLKGFRKILSIKKVLYHELAHNVHSEHDNEFFLLMRQIERECNELDWTQGQGLVTGGPTKRTMDTSLFDQTGQFEGGTFRLGGVPIEPAEGTPKRDLAARAALLRLTAEEKEIKRHCGHCKKGK